MPFGHSTEKSTERQNTGPRQESPFLKLAPGERVIRILDDEECAFWQYWLKVNVGGKQQGRSIIVGYDNPIKQRMEALGKDHPDFQKPSKRIRINVLDRTPVKFTSDNIAVYADENGNFPSATPEGEVLTDRPVLPHNRVRIMEFGLDFMKRLGMLHNRQMNRQTFKKMVIQDFDIQIVTEKTGDRDRDVTRSPYPHLDQDPLPAALASLQRYDIATISRPLPNEAIELLLEGQDYREVLTQFGFQPGYYPLLDDQAPF